MKSSSALKDSTGKSLYLYTWTPPRKPVAAVQIIHGMAEHAGRYNQFANFLTKSGYVVIAHDHRGHGKTDPDQLGFVEEEKGFELLTENVHDVYQHLKETYPDLPVIMLGHSMGSFLLQRLLQTSEVHPDGIIYSGSNGKPPFTLHAGILISSILKKVFGADAKSPLLEKLSFGAYNKTFKPNRTEFDWLSRDNEMVDLYIDDPLCGFTCTTSFYYQLFTGIKAIHSHKPFADHSKEIPILVLSGDHDPVSNMGKGIKNLEKTIRNSGIHELDVQLYPGGRHEMLNETNREEVMVTILEWIHSKVNADHPE
ncbi:MAG: alpha/beta hydrolase [Balneolaceae bacterium]|nr:alpha/beta hydrolase [Balneolaceae bacterium]